MAKWPYSTARWQKLRRYKLSLNPLCEHCLLERRTTPAQHVDHIKAIKQGGCPWDMDNLQSLCASCHTRKTVVVDIGGAERLPVKGIDPMTGKPLDPQHWFNEKISQD